MTHPQGIMEINQNMTPITVGRKKITVQGDARRHLRNGAETRFRHGIVAHEQPKDKSWIIPKATHLWKAIGDTMQSRQQKEEEPKRTKIKDEAKGTNTLVSHKQKGVKSNKRCTR